MVARRLLIFVAILMGLTALAAGLAAPQNQKPIATPESDRPGAVRTASPLVEREIDIAEPQTIAVNEGDEVRLTVSGDALDVVELVGLDLLQPIAPETPAVFDLNADDAGSYPIRLVETGRRAGRLRVTPAAE
jgi:hypothetical protein